MGLVSTFLLMFFFIIFYNNITFTCSRKFDNHAESRSFIGFGTHTATQRPCVCNTTTSCACCQIVTILYKPLTPKRLCFNINYQANILNVDLSLDKLIMNSMTVANYRPFEMCAKLPGVIFSSVCVSIAVIQQLPGPAVLVCPIMVLTTKKETWNIPYICSTLMANGTAGMGMMVMMQRPGTPGAMPAPPPGTVAGMPAAMGLPPGATGLPPGAMGLPPGATGQMPGAMGLPPGAMGLPPGAMGLPPGATGLRPGAMGLPPGAMGLPPGAMGLPPGAMGAMMPSAALVATRPPAPATGAMPMAPAAGARPPAPAMGAMPATPAAPTGAASTIIPRINAAGNPVLFFVMNRDLVTALESMITEASASMAMTQENYGFARESSFDSGITILGSETDLPNDDKESLLIASNGDEHTMDQSSNQESYEQNLKVESTTETEGNLKNLKRKKRNYDLFDILHQSNRCERAYRICITRSKHYIVSRLRNSKQNAQIKNDDCEKLVKIVHEPDANLCTQFNWNDNTTPPQLTYPPLESHDAITYTDSTDDSLGAIVIKDEYSEGSDFHPQNNQYPLPLLTYTKADMYPSRIPPIALKEALSRSSNESILPENLTNDKTIMLAIKK